MVKMKELYYFIAFCSTIVLIACLLMFIKYFYDIVAKKECAKAKIYKSAKNFFCATMREDKTIGIKRIAYPMAIFAIVHLILSYFLASTSIGSLYEKEEYTEIYEAIILCGDIEVICKAELERYEEFYAYGSNGLQYKINSIILPYGEELSFDDYTIPYDISENASNYLKIDEKSWMTTDKFKITIVGIADETTDEKMGFQDAFASGDYCKSINSDVVHKTTCHYVNNISEENVIYIKSLYVASLYGCDVCSCCIGE